MPTLQNAQYLLRILKESGPEVALDLFERSGLARNRFERALRYLEDVGLVRLGRRTGGRWAVELV